MPCAFRPAAIRARSGGDEESAEEIFRSLYPDCRLVWVRLAPQRDMYSRFHVVGLVDVRRRRAEPPTVDGPHGEDQRDHIPRRDGDGTAEARFTTVASLTEWRDGRQPARMNAELEAANASPDGRERIPDPA